MGNLTDDMTRLRGDVEALRSVRGALMRDLTRGAKDLATTVSAMRADFSAAHAAMAKQTRGERETFVAAVICEVNSLLSAFSRDREDMARKGRHDRGVFLSEMRRQVTGLRQETADDLMGARLTWRGRSLGKYRPVPMNKEPVAVKPISTPVEAASEKTVAAPETKPEKLSVTLGEPLKKEEAKKMVATPKLKEEKPPVTLKEPLKKEEKRRTGAAAPEVSAVETSRVKVPPSVSASMPPFQKSKEMSRLDEKPAKVMTRPKRGRK